MIHHIIGTPIFKRGNSWPMFRVPVGTDLERIPDGLRDHAAFVLDLIGWKLVNWQSDAGGWVLLKSEYLRRVLSRNVWPALRSEMINLGMLECDHCYVIGEKSFCYRVPNPFQPTRPDQHRVDSAENRVAPPAPAGSCGDRTICRSHEQELVTSWGEPTG